MVEASDFLAATADGVGVRLVVTPKASRDRVEGVRREADGGAVLRVAVTAAPEDGKANAAVIKLLAKTWRLPKSAFSIRVGATARRKTIFIEGDGEDLARRIRQWVKDDHE